MSLLAALAASLLIGPAPALQPLPTMLPPHVAIPAPAAPPTIDAASFALHAVGPDVELWSQNADTARAMASVTKVMTALLVVENLDPDETTVVSPTAAAVGIGYVGQPELLEGEVWRIEDLLAFMMVQSGNDAAVALGEAVAVTEAEFVSQMNERAAELGLDDTTYRNPNGLDAPGQVQSARDLVRLGLAVVDDPRIMRVTRLKAVTFTPGTREVRITNTNRLIGSFPGLLGIKTGDTANARQVLLAYLDTGVHRYLSVVMGARSHVVETQKLMAWALDALGPADHLAAPALTDPGTDAGPAWAEARARAVRPLPDGGDRPVGQTPAEERVVAQLADLLPSVLGGRP